MPGTLNNATGGPGYFVFQDSVGANLTSRHATVDDLPASESNVVASADVTGQTAGVASLTTYTPAALGTYEIAGYVMIASIVVDVAQFQVTWTDEASNARTMIFSPNGVTSVNLSAVGFYSFAVQPIRVKASTAITVSVVLTTFIGSISFDAGAFIRKPY